MINRGFKFKLNPTHGQENQFRQFSGVCRLVYNLALEQRRDWWRHFRSITGQQLNYAAQCRELTKLRAEFDWVAAVSQTCQQQALRDLDRAFANFFAGRADYPMPHRKGINDAFRFHARECETKRINARWSAVRLPKIGWVKFRDTRPLRGSVKNVTVSQGATGWHVSFACEVEHEAPINILPSVGIDRGVANTLSLSTGEHFSVPASLRAIERKRRIAQRAASRKICGSKRHAKAKRRVAVLAARQARIRMDWHHKTTLSLVRRFGTIVLEDLKIASMTASAKGTIEAPGKNVRQKAGLNRSILNQGWYAFETTLAYKLEENGGHLCKVDPAYTSQTCSCCGTIDKKSRESQAVFSCQHCGFRGHADHNAALNILRRNTAFKHTEEAAWVAL